MAAKNRPAPGSPDGSTDRALRAHEDTIGELIADQRDIPRTPYTVAQVVPLVTLRAAPNVSIDGRKSNNLRLVLNQNVTISNPERVIAGQIINLSLIQDSTGSRTVTWGSAWLFTGGVNTATTTANGIDLYSGRVESVSPNGTATVILGSLARALA